MPTSVKIDKITGPTKRTTGGYDVTVTATITLGTNAKSFSSSTFYFRNPTSNVVAGDVPPWTAPAPGKSVTITFKPYPSPIYAPGKWTAFAYVQDDTTATSADQMDFNVP